MAKKQPGSTRLKIPARIKGNKVATAEFRRLGRMLLEHNVLKAFDEDSLAGLALTHADLLEEEAKLAKEGRMLTGSKGTPYANPRCWIVRDLREALARAHAAFGMSPAARSRIKEPLKESVGAEGFADRVIVLYRGRVVESGSVDAVLSNPQHSYTQALIACIPKIGDRRERLTTIEDQISQPAD